MEYYSGKKKKEQITDTYYNMDETPKRYAKWRKANAQNHILYNSTDMKCPEKAYL